MEDRPTYSKWKRKLGGMKVCPACGKQNKLIRRTASGVERLKQCTVCGADLPSKLTFPKRAKVTWYVREFDPQTGRTKDYPCDSCEEADELIRQKKRDFTSDPVQRRLLEHVSVLVRGIRCDDYDQAVNVLIEKLGGDPTARTLKAIGWDEAVELICDELLQKGRSPVYLLDIRRVAADLRTITGLEEWSLVDLEAIGQYRKARLQGWMRDGKPVRPVGGQAVNKDLNTLSAFLARAERKGWVARNVLRNQPDERIKVRSVRVDYMPDEDLRTLIKAAETVWMKALLLVAYYTGARRNDLLRLEWERDIDLDGKRAVAEGRVGPHIYIQGTKADTPHWMPLHSSAVVALRQLRAQPVIDPKVFPLKSTSPGSKLSTMFGELCMQAGLTMEAKRDGKTYTKNRWSLHDLRRKANTDLRNRGASPKERATLLGHRTTAVNESHYEAVLPQRERELIDDLPTF